MAEQNEYKPATEKQVKYLHVLLKKAGKPADHSDLAQLDSKVASKMIEDLAASQPATKTSSETRKVHNGDSLRIGLACKIIGQNWLRLGRNPKTWKDDFNEQVNDTNDAFARAETYVKKQGEVVR